MKAPLAVLWGLTLLLGASNGQSGECDHCSYVSPFQTYYIFSPGYPDLYQGSQSCRWTMRSEFNMRLNCTLEMPWSVNCYEDSLLVGVNSSTQHKYCGDGTFSIDSDGPTMSVQFQSAFWTRGGRFMCNVTALTSQFEENCRCGRKNPSKIVGGTETGVNEYPMMCALVDFAKRIPFCGCTIIHEKYVVTAAHCLYAMNLTNIGILVGDHDITVGNDTDASRIYGADMNITNPGYNVNTGQNDIAILRVKEVIEFSDKVGPACLPFQHAPDTFGGDLVTALGWGALEYSGSWSTTLQGVQMDVLTNLDCKKNYPSVTLEQICTYGKNKDSCQMDSGGPIIWENPTSHNLVLIGVINGGRGCGLYGSLNCKVGAFVDWIAASTPDANYCIIE
ncbi:venom serine protease 34 [Halictus rubicundus]|uniref:venom serine protease 34 n=1 Tax=Halictus rubicundus TaxID=77578 RepID=UPI004035EBB1